MSKTPKTPAAPKGAVKQSAAAPQINKLPAPFGVGAPTRRAANSTPPATPPPAGETGRELSSDEAAAALAGTIPARRQPTDAEIDGVKSQLDAHFGMDVTKVVTEAVDGAATRLETERAKAAPKRLCPNCTGLGTVAQGNGRTRCTVCDGAGELART
jgi:hypothetical protein